ncbi:MAG: ribosomal protein S18-alanine N-acetyltransferase, partial [Giesbergeria sp.]
MNAVLVPPTGLPEVRLEPLTLDRLDQLLAVEAQAYEFPWSRGNFTDSLTSGYAVQLLCAG